jgi:hypothetical protein
MPKLNKMKTKDLREECQMWRNLWGWVPPEVKYYLARIGQNVGVTMRNYKRYLGVLIDTHWTLDELEIGTTDKVYDLVEDKTYFEKKVVKVRTGSIMDLQWIKERKSQETFEAEVMAEEKAEQERINKEQAKEISEPEPEDMNGALLDEDESQ